MKENIRKIKLPKQKKITTQEYINGIVNGDRMILSKAITLIESSNLKHQKTAEAIIEACLTHSGKSIRIGITGVPGVGKSTFIEAFGSFLIEEKKRKVAVLAIDPSSNKNRGSILGDKTRMNELSTNKNAFIRPSPSSGSLGGVAKATRETIVLCEAAGFDTILIETVGVGQSEVEVKSMVDFFLLLMLSGAGDELQGIKRGIMEMADAILINKADSDNIKLAKLARQTYKNAIHLFPANENGWTPKVEICSATEKVNIDQSWKIIEDFITITSANNSFDDNRNKQAQFWLHQTILSSLKTMFYTDKKVVSKIKEMEKNVLLNKITPFKAANELTKLFKG